MNRVLHNENLLSDEMPAVVAKKKKNRNYSFCASRRLPSDKMTEVNGIRIPSMPGSCYHAIIATLAENRDKFCAWNKIVELTCHNMRKYGGQKAWDQFSQKNDVKSYEQRIKDNTHTLTRTGKDCYGYRLHEQGMCIYYFKDGAVLFTGGELQEQPLDNNKQGVSHKYDVVFPDGRRLQTRYRGTTMTYKEYKRFLEMGFIDITGKILDADSIKTLRAEGTALSSPIDIEKNLLGKEDLPVNVCVSLKDTFDQRTADRLEALGLKVEQAIENEIIGTINKSQIASLRQDVDVKDVEVEGE